MTDRTDSTIIPLAAEEIAIGKREVVTGTVRVRTVVESQQAWVDELLHRTDVEVERREVDRIVEAAPQVRQEGDAIVVPVLEEVLVVEKRLRLKEEIVLRWKRREEHHREPVILRREIAIVEQQPPESEREQDPEPGDI